jgi:hypothetical protein
MKGFQPPKCRPGSVVLMESSGLDKGFIGSSLGSHWDRVTFTDFGIRDLGQNLGLGDCSMNLIK